MRSRFTNLILLFIACVAAALGIKYTDVLDTGIGKYLNDGVASLQKIIYSEAPRPELSLQEKEKLRQELAKKSQAGSFFCGSSFFTFIPGAEFRYQTSGGFAQDTVRVGVPAPDGNNHYIDGSLESAKEWTTRTIFKCDTGKIKLTDFNFWEVYAKTDIIATPCIAGEFNFSLPRDQDLVKGNGWVEKGCLRYEGMRNEERETRNAKSGTWDSGLKKDSGLFQENLEARWKVLGEEKITVPAGEFDAEKLEISLARTQNVSGGIRKVEAIYRIWAARGVGAVKIVYEELNIGGKPSGQKPVVQELTAFQIPAK